MDSIISFGEKNRSIQFYGFEFNCSVMCDDRSRDRFKRKSVPSVSETEDQFHCKICFRFWIDSQFARLLSI